MIKFIKYTVVGGLATAIDWSVFFVLNVVLKFPYYYAIVVSFICGAAVKFFINKGFTFKNKSDKYIHQMVLFLIGNFFVLIMSGGVMYFFISVMAINSMISRIITTVIFLFVNFLFDKTVTYNTRWYNGSKT